MCLKCLGEGLASKYLLKGHSLEKKIIIKARGRWRVRHRPDPDTSPACLPEVCRNRAAFFYCSVWMEP